MNSGSRKSKNIHQATSLITDAASSGARLIVLPELFNWRGDHREMVNNAEPIPGPTSLHMAELAARLRVFLLCGSMIESNPSGSKPFNTGFLVSPSGRIIARYRKLHLFRACLKNGKVINEKNLYSAGNGITVVSTPFGRLGFTICYDLRFPEHFRSLIDRGAQLIAVPSAFTRETGKAHWEVLLRARAIENQVYIIAPNQHGTDPLGTKNYGHSMIVDPWGRVIARASRGKNIIYARLNPLYLKEVRRNLPVLKHRVIFSCRDAAP